MYCTVFGKLSLDLFAVIKYTVNDFPGHLVGCELI